MATHRVFRVKIRGFQSDTTIQRKPAQRTRSTIGIAVGAPALADCGDWHVQWEESAP
jgi:hypothetical protein